jgi:hypothetical protein
MITEVGAERKTMTIIMMPSEFAGAARGGIAQLAVRLIGCRTPSTGWFGNFR